MRPFLARGVCDQEGFINLEAAVAEVSKSGKGQPDGSAAVDKLRQPVGHQGDGGLHRYPESRLAGPGFSTEGIALLTSSVRFAHLARLSQLTRRRPSRLMLAVNSHSHRVLRLLDILVQTLNFAAKLCASREVGRVELCQAVQPCA